MRIIIGICKTTALVIIIASTSFRINWFQKIRCSREYKTSDWPVTIKTQPTEISVIYKTKLSEKTKFLRRKPIV